MAWTICTDSFKFADGTVGVPTPFPTNYMSAGTLQRVDFVSGGSSPFVVEKPTIGEWIIGPNAEGSYFSINVTGYGDGSWGHVTIEGNITFWHEPSRRSMSASIGFNGEDGLKLGVGLYYDEDNEKAGFIKFEGDSRGYVETTTSDPGYPNTSKHFYNFLKNNIYVPGATVKVNYYLPDYEYTYAKITYKQDSEPDSETDGESVEILKDETSVNIEGLEEDKTYYFKIFTDKSESEAFPYTVEVDPVPPEYKTYIDNINGTGFDWIKNLQSEEVSATFTDHVTLTGLNMNFNPSSRTWYTYSHLGTELEYWNKTGFSYVTSALFVSTIGIDSVNITGSDDSYTCTINKNNSDTEVYNNGMFVYDKNMSMGVTSANGIPRKWFANFNFNPNYLYYGNCNPFYNGSWSTRTFTGTLTQVFEQLQRYARNIDIYVDGVLWSKAGK